MVKHLQIILLLFATSAVGQNVITFQAAPATHAPVASVLWTDPNAGDLIALWTMQDTNTLGITDNADTNDVRSIPDVATGPALHVIGGTNAASTETYVVRGDGADDALTLPTVGGGGNDSKIPSTGDFTLEAWANTDVLPPNSDLDFVAGEWNTDGGNGRIAIMVQDEDNGQDDKWALFLSSTAALGFVKLYSDSVAVTGQWTHLCVTRSTTQTIFYVDGIAASTNNDASVRVFAGGNAFKILSAFGTTTPDSFYFDGLVGEVGLYDVALSAAEVLELKNNTPPSDYLRNY